MADDRDILTESDLHVFQHRVIDHMIEAERSIVIVPVGGGKTVMSGTAYKELKDADLVDCAFVLAPKRVAIDVWNKEMPHWAHLQGLTTSLIVGTPKQRLAALKVKADIYIANFDILEWLQKVVGKFDTRTMVIIDELTKLKAPTGVRAKAMRKLVGTSRFRTGMTGTPKPKDHMDLFNQVLLIKGPKLWGDNFYKWRARYFRTVDADGFQWEIREGHGELLDRQYAKEVFIVTEEELGKAFIKPVHVPRYITIPPSVMRAHDKALTSWILETVKPGGDIVKQLLANSAVGSGKSRQIASGFAYGENREVHEFHRLKIEALQELVESIDDQVMVTYEFLPELEAMRAAFPDLRVIGDGVSDAEISQTVEDWTNGTARIVAIHPASAGHGLNLQYGGRHLIWFTMPWSLELYRQTIGRLARQGQKRTVFVHSLIAEGTVESAAVVPRLQERGDAEDQLKALAHRMLTTAKRGASHGNRTTPRQARETSRPVRRRAAADRRQQ